MPDTMYRGCRIERVENAINVGYAPARHNREKHTLTERTRKVTGWVVHYPGGGTSWADTLKKAKERVDDYIGNPT